MANATEPLYVLSPLAKIEWYPPSRIYQQPPLTISLAHYLYLITGPLVNLHVYVIR